MGQIPTPIAGGATLNSPGAKHQRPHMMNMQKVTTPLLLHLLQ